jgi:ubiquinone/menaquinone biosynthesis C-methylase UbiE
MMCTCCGAAPGGAGGDKRWARPNWTRRLFAKINAAGDEMTNRLLGGRKRALLSELTGDVVEIGPGSGANLEFYPPSVRWIGIEPNPYMHRYLREKAERLGLEVDLRQGTAEQTGLPDNSADAVVSTLVLCSVDDVAASLREARRILRPGGRFVFVEHVAAPAGSFVRRVQDWIQPLWTFCADGCHPNRETWAELERASFDSLEYERFEMDIPLKFIAPAIAGTATTGTIAASP